MGKSARSATAIDRTIGANLRHLRHCAGVSLEDIATVLGVAYQQVQKYETGRNRVSAPMLVRLRDFYDIPYDLFFDGVAVRPGRRAAKPVLPDLKMPDRETASACRKVAALGDDGLRRKICRIIDILAG